MHIDLLNILRCPQTGQPLFLEDPEYREEQIYSGWLVTADGAYRYPIREFIPRFVPESNYADNFGMQWNRFRQTQLDSYSGHPISAERFWKATGWKPEELAGQWVLDVGCGAGRFAEVALQAGAKVMNYDGILPLSESQHLEWSLLDTFDMLAPAYDQPQTPATVRRWLESAGLEQIEILRAGHLVGRGTVPHALGH